MITQEVFVEPSAVTVALPEEQVVLCHEVLGEAGLRVHRAEHVLAACERIAKLLPQVVVSSAALRNDAREMIEERAVAALKAFCSNSAWQLPTKPTTICALGTSSGRKRVSLCSAGDFTRVDTARAFGRPGELFRPREYGAE